MSPMGRMWLQLIRKEIESFVNSHALLINFLRPLSLRTNAIKERVVAYALTI